VCSIFKKNKERCNDIERQNLFANIRENMLLIFYRDIKFEWAGEVYTGCCTRNERSGLA
jgi:hypothetical protein